MGSEYELKFRATPAQLEQLLTDFPGDWQEIPMKTTYFDTADRRISQKKQTLRQRMEGGHGVCTLKTPASGGIRGEWEVPGEALGAALPLLSRQSGLCLPRPSELIPVCGATFTRLALRLSFGDWEAELSLDRGMLQNGPHALPFAEVELELKAGAPGQLDRFGREFQVRYHLETEPRSKYLRARLLGEEDPHGI